jgi:hypothetical protein
MRRSLTQVEKGQNVIGIKDPKNVLIERTKTNNFISENDEISNIAIGGLVDEKTGAFHPVSQVGFGQIQQDEDINFDEFDIKHRNNPQVVPHVAKEIFFYLKGLEVTLILD